MRFLKNHFLKLTLILSCLFLGSCILPNQQTEEIKHKETACCMIAMTDEELEKVYASGLTLRFEKSDIDDQEALKFIENIIVDIEKDTGIDPLLIDYDVTVIGLRYDDGVTPVELDPLNGSVKLNLPYIEKMIIETSLDFGTIYLLNVDLRNTVIKIEYDNTNWGKR